MRKKKQKGFTLIEISLVLAIVVSLALLASVNMAPASRKIALQSTISTLMTQLRAQQLKSMLGEEGGVYFENGRYILFQGSAYSAGDSKNQIISLEKNVVFAEISFPQSFLVFAKGSGEIVDYDQGKDSITVKGSDGEERRLKVNKYGVVVME